MKTLLQLKVEAQNEANKIANELTPKFRAIFKPFLGKRVINNTGELKNKINELLLPLIKDGVILYLNKTEYFLHFTVNVNKSDNNQIAYAKAQFYVGDISKGVLTDIYDMYVPLREDYTEDYVISLRERLKDLKNEISGMEQQLVPFGLFDR